MTTPVTKQTPIPSPPISSLLTSPGLSDDTGVRGETEFLDCRKKERKPGPDTDDRDYFATQLDKMSSEQAEALRKIFAVMQDFLLND